MSDARRETSSHRFALKRSAYGRAFQSNSLRPSSAHVPQFSLRIVRAVLEKILRDSRLLLKSFRFSAKPLAHIRSLALRLYQLIKAIVSGNGQGVNRHRIALIKPKQNRGLKLRFCRRLLRNNDKLWRACGSHKLNREPSISCNCRAELSPRLALGLIGYEISILNQAQYPPTLYDIHCLMLLNLESALNAADRNREFDCRWNMPRG